MTTDLATIAEAAKNAPMVEMPTRHFLCEGMYLRQILIPAATIFVGRKHKRLHYFICAKGSAGIKMGEEVKVIRAGMVFISGPGAERAGVTYEDTVFMTVHRTELESLEEIELDLVEYNPNSRYGVGNLIKPDSLEHKL